MPQVTISAPEIRHALMPPFCVICGAPAGHRVKHAFRWYPTWVLLTALLIAFLVPPASLLLAVAFAVALRRRMDVVVPTCERHRGFWAARKRGMYFCAAVGVLACGGLYAYLLALPASRAEELKWWFVFGMIAMFYGTVAIVGLMSLGVRAVRITDQSVTLTRIHPTFVAAVQHLREQTRRADQGQTWDDQLREMRKRRERRIWTDPAGEVPGEPEPRPATGPAYDDAEWRAGELLDRDDPPPDRPAR